MKTLNKNQSIAVFVGLALLSYLLFSDQIMNLFNPSIESLNSQESQAGVKVEDVAVGTGPLAEPGDVLTVNYVGNLEDGKVFDSSVDRGVPFTFTLGVGQVISGWDEGVAGMRAGGKRVLTVPPEYAYGEQGVGPIPPNSTLIFEVELLNVEKPVSEPVQ